MGINTGKDIPPGNWSPASFLKGRYSESMFLSSVTPHEVEDFISQMDNNKSIGPFSIPVPLLKILKTQIALLLSLINDSFLCGTFPNRLKLAKVTPDKAKIIRGLYLSYLYLVRYMKKPCISAFTVILSIILFSTHFSLVSGKTSPEITDILSPLTIISGISHYTPAQ